MRRAYAQVPALGPYLDSEDKLLRWAVVTAVPARIAGGSGEGIEPALHTLASGSSLWGPQ
ncbi:hypothetical protein OG288_42935 [Streptomyces tauricus]|uniref:Uncharacterized protein n=1 Tax=Streptomyces tauricus TaxID=68274 RepID=A0ABZ1JT49_9ACTN|nr:hypothetical protein [Streptomyces tauricus]MCW8103478.1 hypothetical protein [Streptomyces tauricus]